MSENDQQNQDNGRSEGNRKNGKSYGGESFIRNGYRGESFRRGSYRGEAYRGEAYRGENYRGELFSDSRDDDEIDIKSLIGTVLRHKWSIIGLTLISAFFATWYAYSVTPVYNSSGTLLIAQSQNRYSVAGSDIGNLLSSSYGLGMGSTLANELVVLKSRRLAMTIADTIIAKGDMRSGKQYPLLWVDYPEDSTLVGTQPGSMRSTRSIVAARIQAGMTVERVERDADLISIGFAAFDPEEAADVVNLAINAYTSLSTEQNRVAASSALAFLERELKTATETLESSEKELGNYMASTGIVQIDDQTGKVIERIATLEGQKQEIEINRVAIESALSKFQQQLDDITPGLAEQLSKNLGQTLERYQFRLAELQTERLLLLERNPSLRNSEIDEPYLNELDSQISTIKREITSLSQEIVGTVENEAFIGFIATDAEDEIAGRIISLRDRIVNLSIEEAQLNAQERVLVDRLKLENEYIDELPDNMLDYARLQRDVNIAESIYLTISRQYAETALWEQTQFGLGRPLDYAVAPLSPFKPNKRLFILIGIFLGGAVGVGLAFGREFLNRTIDGLDKLKGSGYPILAVIPDFTEYVKKKYEEKSKVAVKGRLVSTNWFSLLDNISPVTESYRRLHNNIIYSQPDLEVKTILVTSPGKGEGKTTTAVNLAGILAESGKRVLIIDFDFRRPNLHKTLGESQTPGILELLFDGVHFDDVIRETAYPGIHCLTTGRRSPNPASVAQSDKLKSIVEGVKDQYDYVVIDSAPYGIITDAAPMMKMADGIVVSVRFNKTQTNELAQTLENLENIHVSILGLSLVGYDHKISSDYYYQNKYKYYSYNDYLEYTEEKEEVA